jgi:beta-glucosidase
VTDLDHTAESTTARLFCPYPQDFLWGAATAAYQVEGAVREDGRTPSVWDTFSHRPGAVAFDQNGDRATDHYHRYPEDVALMKRLGLQAYRFSVSWSRIFPEANCVPNPKGLDFYKRLVDELRAADIQPWMTLFHWDLPQWAEDRFGGWESRDCARMFADYAGYMAAELGDRLSGVFTINEFMCFLDKGYVDTGELFAPGKNVSKRILNQARHHAVYGHGLAVQAIRASGPAGLKVGLAENIPNIVPILETPEHIAAAREALRELSGMYLTPIFEGQYHPAYLEDAGDDAPSFTDDEMAAIASPIDFLGLNLYAPTYARHDPSSARGWSAVDCGPGYPRMDMPWLAVGPSIMYWGPRLVSEAWSAPAIYITENGCANPDRLTPGNEIMDVGRVMYLQEHLIHLHRAAVRYPVKGYFVWSLMDNFEWACGYTKRFGICYVNYETQERTPKLSAEFYSGVIARNAVGGG